MKWLFVRNLLSFGFWARFLATAPPFIVVSVVVRLATRGSDMGDSGAWAAALFWLFICGVWVLSVLALLIHCFRQKAFKKSAGFWLGFAVGGLSLGLFPLIS